MKGKILLTFLFCFFSFSYAAQTFCQDAANEGQNRWHENDCRRFYRCWDSRALELLCPANSLPYFDSCSLACVNNPQAVCGDPGNRCNVETTTEDIEKTTEFTVPTAPIITPTAPTINPPVNK